MPARASEAAFANSASSVDGIPWVKSGNGRELCWSCCSGSDASGNESLKRGIDTEEAPVGGPEVLFGESRFLSAGTVSELLSRDEAAKEGPVPAVIGPAGLSVSWPSGFLGGSFLLFPYERERDSGRKIRMGAL